MPDEGPPSKHEPAASPEARSLGRLGFKNLNQLTRASFRHASDLKVSQDAEVALSLSFPALKTRLPPRIPSLRDSLGSMLGIPTEDEIVFVRNMFSKYTLEQENRRVATQGI